MSDIELDEELFGATHIGNTADTQSIEAQLKLYQQHLQELPASATLVDRGRVQLDIAETLLALERMDEAWSTAREALDIFMKEQQWQDAVESYNVLFQCEQPASLAALGQGVWLAVTFPIEPDTTVAMLNHIIDETPDDSDGAAVAAMVAHYIADIRASDDKHESLTFLTTNVLARVAKRHSQITSQEEMQAWIEKLHLDKPEEFLPRLSTVIDVLVQDEWWFDRDAIRETLPVN